MVVGGTGLDFVAGTPVFAFFGRLFDRAVWPRTPDTATRQFEAWIYSVLGATIAGWGLCLALVVANAFPTHQAWAWRAVAAGVALWFPLDMVRSIIHRVWANVAFNCVLLLLMAIPLAGTFGEFHRAVPTAMSVQTRSGRKRFNAPLHCGVR